MLWPMEEIGASGLSLEWISPHSFHRKSKQSKECLTAVVSQTALCSPAIPMNTHLSTHTNTHHHTSNV